MSFKNSPLNLLEALTPSVRHFHVPAGVWSRGMEGPISSLPEGSPPPTCQIQTQAMLTCMTEDSYRVSQKSLLATGLLAGPLLGYLGFKEGGGVGWSAMALGGAFTVVPLLRWVGNAKNRRDILASGMGEGIHPGSVTPVSSVGPRGQSVSSGCGHPLWAPIQPARPA